MLNNTPNIKISRIKIIVPFFLLYLILISAIFNFYADVISNYEEKLSSTQNKAIGIEYLKLLNRFTVDIIDMQDKKQVTPFIKGDIETIHSFQDSYPMFKNIELDKYFISIKEISFDTDSNKEYYKFLDYINHLNYTVGNDAGILFSKEKQHYFLGSLITHYLPEFLISIGISHNLLEEFIATKHIASDKKSIYIEQNKLMSLSSEELSNIILLLQEFSQTERLSNMIKKIQVKLDELKNNRSNLIILNNNVDSFKLDLEIIHEIVELGSELNGITIFTLERLLQKDASSFENKIFNYQLLITFMIALITALFIYFFRIFVSNIKKDEKLEEFNQTLLSTIVEEVQKNREKDKQLMQQNRLAQMGEMISMIAHQWRQPLAAISSTSASLELKAQLKKLDNETILRNAQNISKYSQHLSATIDDFREFFKSEKEKMEVSYTQLVESVLGIVEVLITNKNIEILKELNTEEKINTYPNEIKQVILNLIKNAEDILIERNIENPYIKISTYVENNKHILRVSDNAGGIPIDVIDNVFDPYFSTKSDKNGTGLGLYMSKIIIEEHCGGKLNVINDEFGAVFTIVLNNINKD